MVLQSLAHPHVVPLYGISLDRATSVLYIVMKHMAGGSVYHKLRDPRVQMTALRVIQWSDETARATPSYYYHRGALLCS